MTNETSPQGLYVIKKEGKRETVKRKGLEVSLLASGDGTEIIHHKLEKGTIWSLVPVEGWVGLEYLMLLNGELTYHAEDGDVQLTAGDSVAANPVDKRSYFTATTDVELIYVTSKPVFHTYSHDIQRMVELAVDIENKDGNTADHCSRIEIMSMILGEALGLDAHQLHTLKYAAFFHDIGKIRVPDAILNKPAALTADEWLIMKQHTTWGKEILEESGIASLVEAGKIVEQHHERFDGKGYPHGLQGAQINILASIISVVDSFDAMTYDRIYRKAKSRAEATEEIVQGRGTMYHPEIVDLFLQNIEKL